MVLTLLIARPFNDALAIVDRVYIPMIIANAVGMYVFCIMVENIRTSGIFRWNAIPCFRKKSNKIPAGIKGR